MTKACSVKTSSQPSSTAVQQPAQRWQARLLYLQNRHYTLGQAPTDDSFEDPYAQ